MSSNHPFVTSIKVLFDILDISRSGYVFLSDIEQYWDDCESPILPSNIVLCLRQFVDKNGMLNFNDFVKGLQLAMNPDTRKDTRFNTEMYISPENKDPRICVDSGQQSQQKSTPNEKSRRKPELDSSCVTRTVVTSQARQASRQTTPSKQSRPGHNSDWSTLSPQKPQSAQTKTESIGHAPAQTRKYRPPSRDYCDEVGPTSRAKSPRRTGSDENIISHGLSTTSHSKNQNGSSYQRPRESQRHTLQSGVDFNMVKAMKQLEQERDVFLQAMELLDQTRKWLDSYLHDIKDRQTLLSSCGRIEVEEDHSYDSNFVLPRVNALTQMLQGLLDSTERGFSGEESDCESTLASQNELMKHALNESEARIKKLEDEKILLVKEVFEERSKRRPMNDDSLM